MSMYIVAEKTDGDVLLHVQGYDTKTDIVEALREDAEAQRESDPELAEILWNQSTGLKRQLDEWDGQDQLEAHVDDTIYYIRQI